MLGIKNMKFRRLVFIQITLGHYHYPRMQTLNSYCRAAGVSLYNIEIASYTTVYHWILENNREGFNNITLFPGQVLEEIPAKKMWPALKNKLEELKPDVVFMVGYSLSVIRRAKLWADENKVATVIISDSNEFDKKRYRIFEFLKSLLISRFDAAFVAGTSASKYMQKLGIPEERITYGCDVIDTTFFSDRASENKKNSSCVREKWNLPEHYFLVVTRLAKEKNLQRLLAAYKEYVIRFGGELDPWKLIICGTGPEEEHLRGQIMDMPEQIRKKIFLYGYVKQPDIIDFYSCASCLVLPSWCETWGLVVNEAMACSLPVIISNKAGCSFDLVRNDFNGWVFDPFNVSELTSLMTKLTRLNESARAEMGLRGREIISTWGLDRYCQGVMESARIAYDHRNQ